MSSVLEIPDEVSSDRAGARASLVESAIEVFGAHGFGVGLREVAAGAGVTAGSVTYFFGGKEGLIAECDRIVLGELRAHMAAISDAGDAGIRLRGDARTHLRNLTYVMRSLVESTNLVPDLIETLLATARAEVRANCGAIGAADAQAIEAASAQIVRRSLGVAMLDHAMAAPRTPQDLQRFLTSCRDTARTALLAQMPPSTD